MARPAAPNPGLACAAADPANGEPDLRADPDAKVAPAKQRSRFNLRGPPALAALAGLGEIVGVAVAAAIYGPGLIFSRAPPTIAVTAIVGAGNDPQAAQMAANVTDRLTDGLAKIGNIRVVALQSGTAPTSPELVSTRWYHYVLHNQTAAVIKAYLLFSGFRRVVIINVPWYLSA